MDGRSPGGGCWWFYRKEEVDALLRDPAYWQHREIEAARRSEAAREARAARETTIWLAARERGASDGRGRRTAEERRLEAWFEARRKARALGRDPACHLRATGFVWDGVVETY